MERILAAGEFPSAFALFRSGTHATRLLLECSRPSRASLEWTLWLPNLVPRACCALSGDVRSEPCWACESSRVADQSSCRRGRECSSWYRALCCRLGWLSQQFTGGFFGRSRFRRNGRTMAPSRQTFFLLCLAWGAPPTSPHHMTRFLWWAGGPGLLLAGWLVLRSCKSALVDELLCGRTGSRIIHTSLRQVHAQGKKNTMAAKSPSNNHTCLDCFVVPVLCKHIGRVDADVVHLNNCSRCIKSRRT